LTGARLGFLTEAANSVGGYLSSALPSADGLNAATMLGVGDGVPPKAFLLLHAEPELDMADPARARAALAAAEFVVALSPFKHGAVDYADVILPVAPFTETAGTFVNCEGRAQEFAAVVLPLGLARPAWKVLRVLGSMLGLAGFGYDSIEAVRRELPSPDEIAARLSNATQTAQSRRRQCARGGARRRRSHLFHRSAGSSRPIAAEDTRRSGAARARQRGDAGRAQAYRRRCGARASGGGRGNDENRG
ncbi:MAG: NADH-quinone oxidoreductase subunit G, partial [Betaproteobacteria bacterium]